MTDERDPERWRELAESLKPDEWFRFAGPTGLVLLRAARNEHGSRQISALMLVSERIDSAALKNLSVRLLAAAVNLPDVESLPAEEAEPFVTAARQLLTELAEEPAGKESQAGSARRPPLTRPDGSDPDAFYRSVAEAYLEVSARTRAVAPELAEEAGVPVPTVHRWVLEARRRGFLPRPVRKGKAG